MRNELMYRISWKSDRVSLLMTKVVGGRTLSPSKASPPPAHHPFTLVRAPKNSFYVQCESVEVSNFVTDPEGRRAKIPTPFLHFLTCQGLVTKATRARAHILIYSYWVWVSIPKYDSVLLTLRNVILMDVITCSKCVRSALQWTWRLLLSFSVLRRMEKNQRFEKPSAAIFKLESSPEISVRRY